ncbi:MAG TPA: serine/threonine-protein kinase [Microbacterium sp.]|nr:serine/threonine-protein kinase [Microbacterium sp.]
MSQRRTPSPPPELAGFTYVEPLGSGGFADVYLYEQQLPKRRVAVKVLLTDRLASGAASEFAAEANVMAMLSTHPAIVTIYQAGVADDGRPYLVMEYCPRPNLQVRYRSEPFSVAESLRVGVQVAAAVETAHRAGVLHRDIKPANILVTEYNRPALTDFGIASTTGAVSESAGMSIPWSPPESFADVPQSGPRSDVYALGATVYTLLAGRSPFELPGERNTSAELMERIERMPLPMLMRADAPDSLQRVLDRAMAKSPADRYPSAVAFARALQKVQIELSHGVTPIDIIDEHPAPEAQQDADEGLTRVRGVVRIDPDAGTTRPSATTAPVQGRPPAPAAAPASADVGETVLRHPAAETTRRITAPTVPDAAADVHAPPADISETVRRPAPSWESHPQPTASPPPAAAAPVPGDAGDAGDDAPSAKRGRSWPAIIAAAVLVLAGVGVALALPGILSGEQDPDPEASATSEPIDDVIGGPVPAVTGVTGVAADAVVVFTWTNPDPQEGDMYLWGPVRVGEETQLEAIPDATATVPADPSGTTCIEVTLRRADSRASTPVTECTP